MQLDLDFIRSRFPGLEGPTILADNGGGSVPVVDVIDGVAAFMRRHMVQLGADYGRSVSALEAVRAGRSVAADLVGGCPDEIVLGASTTANIQLLARSLAPLLAPGDEIIVTNLDHEANIGPWRRLTNIGVVVREWAFDAESATLRMQELEALLGPRTRLVCFTHVSNVVGQIHDVRTFARRIRDAGAWSMVDGVAFAPHRRVNVSDLGVDFYALSLYKTYGPHLGLLWGRRDLLVAAHGQNHSIHPESAVPLKLEPGNVNYELVAALTGLGAYLDRIYAHHTDADNEPRARSTDSTTSPTSGPQGRTHAWNQVFDWFAEHEQRLSSRLLAYLNKRDDVHVIGTSHADRGLRVPTIAFSCDGRRSDEIVTALNEQDIGVRFGHFYAYRAVEAMGLADRGGIIRVSFVHYNTEKEVDRVIEAIDAVTR